MKKNISIKPESFVAELKKNNLGPMVEVPCSYLKDFLNYLWDTEEIKIINPVNEAVVMAIAAGEYLGSGKIPIVALQNSGFGNTINALTSLNQMYDIPAFMMVTWRGEGGAGRDAPEHDITGENLLKYLKTYNLPYEIADPKSYKTQIKNLTQIAQKTHKPVVMVIKKTTFAPYAVQNGKKKKTGMTRFDAIELIKKEAKRKGIFLSGTGFPSRDSFNARDTSDFYVMGSMGHVSGIGLGVAAANPKKKIIVLDGDGGAVMHAGTFASLDARIHKNYLYIMLDNGVYESTGGQKAVSQHVDFKLFAKAFGFKKYYLAKNSNDLKISLGKALAVKVPTFLHVKVVTGEHAGVRVSDKYTCAEVTDRFMAVFASPKPK